MYWADVTIEGYESLNMLDVYLSKPLFVFELYIWFHCKQVLSPHMQVNFLCVITQLREFSLFSKVSDLLTLRGWVSCGCGEHGISHEALGLASPSNPGCWVFSRHMAPAFGESFSQSQGGWRFFLVKTFIRI